MTVLLARNQRNSRYLFDWSARYCVERTSDNSLSGQAATFSRAGVATSIGSGGQVVQAAHSQSRYIWLDLDGDGVRETPHLLLEDTRTNLLLRSQEFDNGSWSKVNVTVTANATTAPDGTATADKVAATATAATTMNQSVVVAAASCAYCIYVKKGTGATVANAFALSNVTTSTTLFVVSINYDTGVVTTTGGTGAAYSVASVDGWWQVVMVVTTGITSGNTIAAAVGFTGNGQTAGDFFYAWGAQLEAAKSISSYSANAGSAVPRVADAMSFTLNSLPRALTLYIDMVDLGSSLLATLPGIVDIGGSGGNLFFVYFANAASPAAILSNNSVNSLGAGAASTGYGDRGEWRATISSAGAATLGLSKNGGAESVGSAGTAVGLPAAWSAATLGLNAVVGFAPGLAAYRTVRLAAGVQTLAYMRNG